jgi:hypothetical protein
MSETFLLQVSLDVVVVFDNVVDDNIVDCGKVDTALVVVIVDWRNIMKRKNIFVENIIATRSLECHKSQLATGCPWCFRLLLTCKK